MSYCSLHSHSWFSLLDGIGNPQKIAKRAAHLGMGAIALTDHGNLGGCVQFSKAVRKQGVRPLLGCEFYLARNDPDLEQGDPELRRANARPYSHLVVLAKNLKGWQGVIRAVSKSWDQGSFYYDPRSYLDWFRDFGNGSDLIAISGHPGSELGNALFKNAKLAYACGDPDTLRSHHIHPDYAAIMTAIAERYISVFGRENFFFEIQVLDPGRMPAAAAIAKVLRWLGKKMGVRCVATADSHYVERADAYDQRTLLCSKLKTTHQRVKQMLDSDEDMALGGFFQSDDFHIPSYEEMLVHHHPEELALSNEIAAMIEDFDITSQPRMPKFSCPDGHDPNSLLREMCQNRFRDRIENRQHELREPLEVYRERLDRELAVFRDVDLSPYFLIIEDVVRFAKNQGWFTGLGRGSAAGSLVSHLLQITGPDPIEHDLMFERFYNAGRNSPGHVSFPDVDLDFPAIKRDEVIPYFQKKYGKDRVAKICTFQTWSGRSALDGVMRAHSIPFDEIKSATKAIPDKARITEELQAMTDRGEEASILRYSLETFADELADYCRLEDDGKLTGQYARYFAQAMRLEGTKSVISTHAAGIVISPEELGHLCPIRYDSASQCYQAMLEYPDLEAMGLLKIDCLSLANLNKSESYADLLATGEIRPAS